MAGVYLKVSPLAAGWAKLQEVQHPSVQLSTKHQHGVSNATCNSLSGYHEETACFGNLAGC